MNNTRFKVFALLIPVLSLLFLIGCAGRQFAPKYAVWYYPPELVQADRAIMDAKKAGKNKTCPVEFNEAKDMKKKAYEVYLACNTKEGIALAQKATKMAKALCPAHPKKPEKVIDRMTIMINFDFDKSNIREADRDELEKGLKFIKKYPHAKIRLEGHTDSIGTEKYNHDLSHRRAASTKKYFVDEGKIEAKRISTIGYGESKPVASNKTPEGRAKNRRVEILILSD
jgi:outer membrane protein OmpA-like peptidoglycan-associated protein